MPPPPRILIVEDEPVLAENLKTYLSRSAPDVRTAADGEHAVEMLDSFEPDALVMDFGLPGMNGVQTYSEIVRRYTRKIDCVMITGDPSDGLTESALNSGIRSVLCKPFSFAELLRRLEPPTGEAPDTQEVKP